RGALFLLQLQQRLEQPELGFVHRLHIDADAAAAGEPDLPGLLVADAVFEAARLLGIHDPQGFLDYRAFHAAAADRAEDAAVAIRDEHAAHRAGRRAPGGDNRRQCYPTALAAPVQGAAEQLQVVQRDRVFHGLTASVWRAAVSAAQDSERGSGGFSYTLVVAR